MKPELALGGCIRNCRVYISRWRKNDQHISAEVVDNLKIRLDRIQSDDSTLAEEVLEVQEQLRLALVEEETFWRQKSRVLWLEEGTKIPSFFMDKRNNVGLATELLGFSSLMVYGRRRSQKLRARQLCTSRICFRHQLHVPTSVTQAMNDALTREGESSRPDGIMALFYQKLWHIIGSQVVSMVQDFMTSGSFDPCLNEVNICLIPKVERSRAMKEFRPISLCNVSYKIISKVLCKRLR